MVRKALKETQLKSWQDVDTVLLEMCRLRRELDLIDQSLSEVVEARKAAARDEAAPLAERMKALELQIKEFADSRPEQFLQCKTLRLNHGSVGYRLSTSLRVPDPVRTLSMLKMLALHQCIRCKEEIDKDQVKALTPAQHADLGVSVVSKNTFGYELAELAVEGV